MKEKIIIFLVGLVLGAIISTASIYFYTLANSSANSNNQGMQMPNSTPPSNQNGGMNGNFTPPEMPNNNSNTSSTTSSN